VEDDFEFPIILSRNKISVRNHEENLKKTPKKHLHRNNFVRSEAFNLFFFFVVVIFFTRFICSMTLRYELLFGIRNRYNNQVLRLHSKICYFLLVKCVIFYFFILTLHPKYKLLTSTNGTNIYMLFL